jgi:hypothetical protein
LTRPADDLISDLLEAYRAEPEQFTLQKVTQLGMTILFAGPENTVTAIDCDVVLLEAAPDIRPRAALLRRRVAGAPGAAGSLRLPWSTDFRTSGWLFRRTSWSRGRMCSPEGWRACRFAGDPGRYLRLAK